MSLRKQINENLKQALKKRRDLEISTLRMLNAVILNKEKIKRYKLSKEKEGLTKEKLERESQLTDEEIIEAVSSEIKKRREASLEFEKGGRKNLAEKEKKEIEVLTGYLPEQLSEEDIKKLAEEAIRINKAETLKDMGKVMGTLMKKVKGRADGSLVSKVVRDLLRS